MAHAKTARSAQRDHMVDRSVASSRPSSTDAPARPSSGEQGDAFARISAGFPSTGPGAGLGIARAIADALRPQCSEYDIIFVDDCSPDDTWEVVAALARANPKVKGLHLMYNEGQAKATLCGLAHASGDGLAITMDDDFQHVPDDMISCSRRCWNTQTSTACLAASKRNITCSTAIWAPA